MAVVEFQPSDWSRGSYLNVGCMWLWTTKDHISFDVGYRVDRFVPFENKEQFEPIADKLAIRALQNVEEYRRLFQSVHDLSNYYLESVPKGFWPSFNAAIAHSLAGRAVAGRRILATCLEDTDDDPPWLKEARSDARSLMASVGDAQTIRDIISGRIGETRKLHNLPPIPKINFDGSL